MKKNTWIAKSTLTAAAALLVMSGGYAKSAHAEEAFSAAQKEELNKIIKEFMMENPQTLIDSLEAFRMEQQRAEAEKAEQTLVEYKEYFARDDAPSFGDANAPITVIEFFDYNCGYCKKALPDIQKIAESTDDVRFVFQEMPILGPTSNTAANWAIAAKKQGKYFEFHSELMKTRGQKNEETFTKIAEDLGLDIEQLKKDAADASVALEIKESMDAARAIGINGTPAFIVNGTMHRGYLGLDGLESAIKAARESKDG